MKAINAKTGAEVRKGDTVTDFRGETATFVSATRTPVPGKSGKVLVDMGGMQREFYEGVFDLRIVE